MLTSSTHALRHVAADLLGQLVAYKDEWSYLKGAVIAGLIVLFVSVAIGFSIEWWLERISGRSEKVS